MRRLKRRLTSNRIKAASIALLLIAGAISYADYMSSRRLILDTHTAKPLLSLIGKVESNSNYNAHFGNPTNSQVKFTDMTVSEVLTWQNNFVNNGSPSSAVGKYQIINSTLQGLVAKLDIPSDQKFDEATQDKMAIALLEKRGVEQYVNNEITETEFAASLAKEWAALPKVTGENPEASYYDGDGLNKARVDSKEVIKAIEPISPKS